MKLLSLSLVLFVTCCSMPTSSQQTRDTGSAQAMSLCAVIADAARYDGKEVLVKGLYRVLVHRSIAMARACSKTDANLRLAPGYKADKKASSILRSQTKKDQFQPVYVVFRGIFRVAQEGQCFGQICVHYEIEATELLSARP